MKLKLQEWTMARWNDLATWRQACVIFQKCSLPSFISTSSVRWPRFDAPWSTNVTHVNITADRLYTHLLVHANIIWNLPRTSKVCFPVLIQSETFEEVLLRDWDARWTSINCWWVSVLSIQRSLEILFCSCFWMGEKKSYSIVMWPDGEKGYDVVTAIGLNV